MKNEPTGYTVYDGPSLIDGRPIIAVLTTHSGNVKTGDMPQLWILARDEKPADAARSGLDAAVCGNCPHRGTIVDGRNVGRTCYVTLFQGPRSVWESWRAGKYPTLTPAEAGARVAGRHVRLGAYGDPGALPLAVSDGLTRFAPKWTGYTHQWKNRPDLAPLVMASVDTPAEAEQARAAGWRFFRVAPADAPLPLEILCPASAEAGKRTTCERCGLCAGTSRPARDIFIPAHGSGASAIRARAEL